MSRIVSILCSLAVVLAVSLASGCGATKGCVDLCTQAQAGGCTAVHGSCSAFCVALDGAQGPSGCTNQRNEYQTCLGVGTNVCDNSCMPQETALTNCLIPYCSAHSSDPNCVTLIASL